MPSVVAKRNATTDPYEVPRTVSQNIFDVCVNVIDERRDIPVIKAQLASVMKASTGRDLL